MESDLGLTPNNDGNVIRLQIPELNEERRRELVKVVHGVAEDGKVAVRNIRRDVMHDLRELKKEGDVGEDDERRAETELQKRTDELDQARSTAPEGQGRRDPGGVRLEPRRLLRCRVRRRRRHDGSARYVAIITDGNGRWAQERGLPTIEGHRPAPTWSRSGSATPSSWGSRELTVFSFSTENWQRPRDEVDGLMAHVRRADRPETPELDEEGVRMRFIGRRRGSRP